MQQHKLEDQGAACEPETVGRGRTGEGEERKRLSECQERTAGEEGKRDRREGRQEGETHGKDGSAWFWGMPPPVLGNLEYEDCLGTTVPGSTFVPTRTT